MSSVGLVIDTRVSLITPPPFPDWVELAGKNNNRIGYTLVRGTTAFAQLSTEGNDETTYAKYANELNVNIQCCDYYNLVRDAIWTVPITGFGDYKLIEFVVVNGSICEACGFDMADYSYTFHVFNPIGIGQITKILPARPNRIAFTIFDGGSPNGTLSTGGTDATSWARIVGNLPQVFHQRDYWPLVKDSVFYFNAGITTIVTVCELYIIPSGGVSQPQNQPLAESAETGGV